MSATSSLMLSRAISHAILHAIPLGLISLPHVGSRGVGYRAAPAPTVQGRDASVRRGRTTGARPTAGIESQALGRSLRVLIDRVGHWSVFSQCFGKKLDGEGPGSAWLALVVDPAVHTIHTLYQARDDKAWEHVLEGALGGESVFFDQV